MIMKEKKALSLKTLTKSNVWDIQENDVFRLWEAAEKEADLRDNQNVYINIIRSAFDIEEIKNELSDLVKFRTLAKRIKKNSKKLTSLKN